MIKLIAVQPRQGMQLLLRFSDGTCGVYDFAHFAAANTPMTAPLNDPVFFSRWFVEAGALAWPNGFDLSARSLQEALCANGALVGGQHAARDVAR